jgi:ADP-ribose pyrophosphatase
MEIKGREWTVASTRTVFSGGPIEAVNVERVRLPDGREIPDYYRIVLADYALVFAVTDDDRVLLLRQYKHGVGRVCVGFPGGALKAGEDPRAAAERELREESGYASSSWRSLGSYVTNANQRCNVAHFFVASGCRRAGDPTEPDLESPDLLLVAKEDLWAAVRLDELAGAAHVALLALATHPMTGDVGSMRRA